MEKRCWFHNLNALLCYSCNSCLILNILFVYKDMIVNENIKNIQICKMGV